MMIILKCVSLTILQLTRQCVPTLSPRQLIRIFSPNLQHSFPKPHTHLLTSLFIQLGVKRNNTKILHILLYKSISLNLYPYTLVSYLQQKERPCYQRQLLWLSSVRSLHLPCSPSPMPWISTSYQIILIIIKTCHFFHLTKIKTKSFLDLPDLCGSLLPSLGKIPHGGSVLVIFTPSLPILSSARARQLSPSCHWNHCCQNHQWFWCSSYVTFQHHLQF